MEALHGSEDMRFVLSQRGPDSSALTWVRAALASDAELIRAGVFVCSCQRAGVGVGVCCKRGVRRGLWQWGWTGWVAVDYF